jgi:glutamate synthase domain-containing protein 2
MPNEQNEQSGSINMFRELHQKFGANFFLTMFLITLFAYAYAQNKLTQCQEGMAEQERVLAEKMQAEQTKTIDYLRKQREKVDVLLYEATKQVKKNKK